MDMRALSLSATSFKIRVLIVIDLCECCVVRSLFWTDFDYLNIFIKVIIANEQDRNLNCVVLIIFLM